MARLKFGSKSTVYTTQLKPYPFNVTFIYGADAMREGYEIGEIPEEWIKDFIEDEYVGITYFNGGNCAVLLADDATIYTLVHECIHCITNMYDVAGLPLSYDTDEPLAYHVENLTRLVQKRLKLPT